MRVDVELVAGERVGRLAAVRKHEARLEALRPGRAHHDAAGRLLLRERAVALAAEGHGEGERAGRRQQQAERGAHEKAQRPRAQQRRQARDQRHHAEHAEGEAGEEQQQLLRFGRHAEPLVQCTASPTTSTTSSPSPSGVMLKRVGSMPRATR